MADDKLHAALVAAECAQNLLFPKIAEYSDCGNDISAEYVSYIVSGLDSARTMLMTQAAVIGYLATPPCNPDRCDGCPENEACDEPAEAVKACAARTIVAAFKAVEEERNV